jgi:transposase
MIKVEARERIRRAYYVEHKSKRQIAREEGCSRQSVDRAVASAEAEPYHLQQPRAAPVLGPFKARIDELLQENERLPRKQRYTGHKIFQCLQAQGYGGSEASVRAYIGRRRRVLRRPEVYLPLEFEPGVDAQVDWGEALAEIGGEQMTVQLFVLRLCYSRRLFVMAFPSQKQEAFFEGHVQAFDYLGAVPQRLTYDNLSAAVRRVLEGRNRQEQEAFVVFRSHYLFESRFCTPGQGHEKGGVEHGVGYARRNFMVPIPQLESFAALNAQLLNACRADEARHPHGMQMSIAEAFAQEQPHLRARPQYAFACCVTRAVTLTPYSQVVFETNRYSVPVQAAAAQLVLKAYPFRIDVLHQTRLIASHPRSYAREQDIFDPLHYLPLLEQRPGAFEHAKPLRQWRAQWPPIYEQLLARLGRQEHGLREFVRILQLHGAYPAALIERAIAQALAYGCVHLDGVRLCLQQLLQPELPPALDLSAQPHLQTIGSQPLDLQRYERLLERN